MRSFIECQLYRWKHHWSFAGCRVSPMYTFSNVLQRQVHSNTHLMRVCVCVVRPTGAK